MKSVLIGICLMVALDVCTSETNWLATTRGVGSPGTPPSRYPFLVGQPNDPVRIMELLKSEAVCDLLPEQTVYRLISTSDPIHGAVYSALLLDTNGVPTHLWSDKEVASFLAELTTDVGSNSNALKLVRAFAALRSYKIVESAPDFKDIRELEKQPAPLTTDFMFFAEDRKSEWRVYATLFTDEYSGSYMRYIFTIYKKPGAGFYFSEPVTVRLRRYVY